MRRWFRRNETTTPAAVPHDPDVRAWAEKADAVASGLSAMGAFAVVLLGESLTSERPSAWFGYQPDREGLGDLLTALGEPQVDVSALLAVEQRFRGRHLGSVPGELAEAWQVRLSEAADRAAGAPDLPGRHPVHLQAEQVWRRAAAAVQPWRAVQLEPERALRQIRWHPGCTTRTFIGYSDPLNLHMVQRAVDEHRYSTDEWEALESCAAPMKRAVDPLGWRLSSLSFALSHLGGGRHEQ